jgi:dTDP-4-amino-4,6-dideoxygalactose transaminase
MNSRLDTLQAAILRVKFRAFKDYELQAVNSAAAAYEKKLGSHQDIITPRPPVGFSSSWAQYTIMLPNRRVREETRKRLKAHDIPSMVYYPRGLHQQTAYKNKLVSDEYFLNTLKATNSVLSLPIHPYLSSDDIEKVTGLLV